MDKLELLTELMESGEFKTPEDFARLEKSLEAGFEPTQFEKDLIEGASLCRYFDRTIYENALRFFPSDTKNEIDFDEFTENPNIEKISGLSGTYRVKRHIKESNLKKFRNESLTTGSRQDFIEKLKAYYKDFEDDLGLLDIEVSTDQQQAKETFTRLFNEADKKFDLARCNDYILVLENHLEFLETELRDLLEEKQQYLKARNYFAPEFYKTNFYLTRKSIVDAFEDLLNPKRDESGKWIYQLFAMGGMGKTMFINWLISRILVPKKIPVARIDFHFLDLSATSKYPWLLIFYIAEQLDFQLKGTPLERLLKKHIDDLPILNPGMNPDKRIDIENSLSSISASVIETYISRMSRALRGYNRPFVVVLDTLERLSLHHTQKLFRVLKMLEKIAEANPQMKLVLSGRYDLSKRITNFKHQFEQNTVRLELHPFNKQESEDYVRDKRNVREDDIVEAIIKKCSTEVKTTQTEEKKKIRCNPFKLSLLTDFYQQKIVESAEDIATLESTDIAYLIERIIKHIPDDNVCWLLRYATIPREFSYDFYKEVLADYLEKESSVRGKRDRANENLPGVSKSDKRKKVWEYTKFKKNSEMLDKTWNNLKNYAGGYSWITIDNQNSDLLRLQLEVVVPMRLLLEKQDVFQPLHRSAIKYFEKKAETAETAEIWAKSITEAIYHHFQIDTKTAERYWRKQLDSAKAQQDATVSKQIAEAILSRDFVNEDEELLKRSDKKTFIVSPPVAYEAHAKAIEAGISLIPRLNAEETLVEWKNVCEHLMWLAGFEKSKSGEIGKYQKPFETKSLLNLARHFGEKSKDNHKAMSLLKAAIDVSKSPSIQLSLEFLLAKVCSKLSDEMAFTHFNNALKIRRKIKYPQLNECRIHLAIGLFNYNLNNIEKARQTFEKTIEVAKAENDFFVQQQTLRNYSDLHIQLGNFNKAYTTLNEVKDLTENTGEENRFVDAIFISQMYARSFYNPLQALREIENYRKPREKLGEDASLTELRGHIDGMLRQFGDAFQQIEKAKSTWGRDANNYSVNRCRLIRISYLLFGIGNFQEAGHHLAVIKVGSPEVTAPENILQMATFDIYHQLKTGKSAEAEANWRKLHDNRKISRIPHLYVQVLGLGIIFNFVDSETIGRFIKLLKDITPVSARLHFLKIFEYAERPFPELRIRHKNQIKRLIRMNSYGMDIIPHALLRARVLNFCGDADSAKSILDEAKNVALKENNAYVLRKILLAMDELDFALSEDIRESSFFEDFSEYRELCFAAYTEQAERFFRADKFDESRACLKTADSLRTNSKLKTWSEASYFETLGKLDQVKGELNKAGLRYKKARQTYLTLGQTESVERLKKKISELTRLGKQKQPNNKIEEQPAELAKSIFDNKKAFNQERIKKTYTIELALSGNYISSGFRLGNSILRNTEAFFDSPISDYVSADISHEEYIYGFSSQLTDNFSTIKTHLGEYCFNDKFRSAVPFHHPAEIKSFDLRLDSLDTALAKIPWELASFEGKPTARIFNNFYRSNTKGNSDSLKNKWIQLVLNKLVGNHLVIDGVFGSQTQSALDDFKRQTNLPKTVPYRKLKEKIQERLINLKSSTNRKVVIIKASREAELNSQRYSGSSMEWAYQDNHFSTETFPSEEIEYLPKYLAKEKPDVIHILSSYRLISHTGEIHLDFFGNDSYREIGRKSAQKSFSKEKVSSFSPTFLKDALSQLPDDKVQPLVILDAICPIEMTEVIHQMLYRNVFANELFQLGDPSAILAIGLAIDQGLQHDLYAPLTNMLSNAECFGQIAQELRNSDNPPNSLESQIPTTGIALFTNEPDLTILPDEV